MENIIYTRKNKEWLFTCTVTKVLFIWGVAIKESLIIIKSGFSTIYSANKFWVKYI